MADPLLAPPSQSLLGQFFARAYADLGDDIGVAIDGTHPFTIEAWVRFGGLCADTAILSREGGYRFGLVGRALMFQIDGFPAVVADVEALELGTEVWHFLAVSFDGSEAVLYVDGRQAGRTVVNGTPPTPTAPHRIASDLQGLIQNVRVYSASRGAETVLDDMFAYDADAPAQGDDPTLVANYDFSVFPPADTSGNDRPVAMQDGATTLASVPALDLHGTAYAQPIRDGDVDPGDGAQPYTVQAWILVETPTPTQYVFCNDDLGADAGMALLLTYSQDADSFHLVAQHGQSGDAYRLTSTATLKAGAWHNVAVTFDGTTLRLYVDGDADASSQPPAIPAHDTGYCLLGAAIEDERPTGAHALQGFLAGVTVWSKCLSADEITTGMTAYPERQDGLTGIYGFSSSPPTRNEANGQPLGLTDGARLYTHSRTITTAAEAAAVQATRAAVRDVARRDLADVDPAPSGEERAAIESDLAGLAAAFAEREGLLQEARAADRAAALGALARNRDAAAVRAELDAAWADTIGRLRSDPTSIHGLITYHATATHHLLVRHTPAGRQVVFRGARDAFSDCAMWRIRYVWTIVSGLLSIFGVYATLTTKATNWINTNILGNAQVMERIYTNAAPGATAIFYFMTVLQAYGLLWPLFKTILTMLGWWALGRLLVKIFTWLTGVGAVAETLASLTIAAAQLVYVITQQPNNCPLIPAE